MGTEATRLVDEIRAQIRPVDERILNHPYLAALEDGRIRPEDLRTFAGQQYHIITSDLASFGRLLARHSALPSRSFLLGLIQGEAAALEALLKFAGALGLDQAGLENFDPIPGGHAYTAFVAWLSFHGSDAEVAAAFLVNLPAWGANCGRMSRALRQRYGLTPEQVSFFELFAQTDPAFEAGALGVIQAGLDRGIPPARISRAARLLQAYELMYWDAMAEAAGVAT